MEKLKFPVFSIKNHRPKMTYLIIDMPSHRDVEKESFKLSYLILTDVKTFP